ncbi:MAG: universal stress protein [Gammaproteobacteria bacterium]|nr:universal stress protein [Gammaproteobacteria bacterium]
MQRFKNILFYVDGQDAPSASLSRAVKLAESNEARLTLVDVIEPVDTPSEIKSRFHVELSDLLKEQRGQALQQLCEPFQQEDHLIYTKVLVGLSFVEIIKYVDNGEFDLLIKQARPPAGISERIFGSHDLHLLRKCPCPVLIDRPGSSAHYQRILAAVDTKPTESGSSDTLVMDLATSLAEREQAGLDVIHAWDLQGESTFRSGRFRLPGMELENMLRHQAEIQQDKLADLLGNYGMKVDDDNVHLVKGESAEAINQLAEHQASDIIVMGTVGRVGIPGLFIGNTAEEVLQTTQSSVLAVKPQGFKSPVL